MEKEISYTRVVPFVRYEKKIKNGKEINVVINNLTSEEIRSMSLKEPKIFETNAEGIYYVSEVPLTYRNTGLRGRLCYVYDELTKEEQAKYFKRSIVIPTTTNVVKSEEDITRKASRKKIRERK